MLLCSPTYAYSYTHTHTHTHTHKHTHTQTHRHTHTHTNIHKHTHTHTHTHTGEDDVAEVLKELTGLESQYDTLAQTLHLPLGTVRTISRDYHFSSRSALGQVVDEWILMNYNHAKFGRPTWRLLVDAVKAVDHDRAKLIASKHLKVCVFPLY